MTPILFLAAASVLLASAAMLVTFGMELSWLEGILLFYGSLAVTELAYLSVCLGFTVPRASTTGLHIDLIEPTDRSAQASSLRTGSGLAHRT